MWYEGNTCNMHLNDLAAEVKAGVVDAGMSLVKVLQRVWKRLLLESTCCLWHASERPGRQRQGRPSRCR